MQAVNIGEPVPAGLVQPLTVVVTLYVPAVDTVIEDELAPVLHDKVPKAVVDNVDVPLQLLTALTVGADGVVGGFAVPLPGELVQLLPLV